MTTYDIRIVNGPNLGHLGVRQPEIYGSQGMQALPELVAKLLGPHSADVRMTVFQSNGEGALIDYLEKAREEGAHGIVLNAGAYTHTSLALADCLAWIGLPCVEVHLSNVLARIDEPLRQKSHIGKHCIGVISGFGLTSYALGVQALLLHIEKT
ncbi:3-dehydroquinate dehydratase [Alkalidesulfovibrio alkalitolerans DSM 16529]|uniref:3-dehydroquinate dehydratase n=1 Tax=Alkalidesulfovibrio alkalitolerans DSM 16529 TaxID=1121439 RepID=S7UDV5_9BACT|nr:type II 3-dehydroquinate dehydratase [Alkalidesulfovibrio alkalitolerans]EPR30393.1 3-dehydroquinate dehydratase [Alkalidesulfovibrio alkalitolerans DSM 16529]